MNTRYSQNSTNSVGTASQNYQMAACENQTKRYYTNMGPLKSSKNSTGNSMKGREEPKKGHQLQFLKPNMNIRYLPNKGSGPNDQVRNHLSKAVQSNEEYPFYKPILGSRRLSTKNQDYDRYPSNRSKKDSSSLLKESSTFRNTINQNHMVSSKAIQQIQQSQKTQSQIQNGYHNRSQENNIDHNYSKFSSPDSKPLGERSAQSSNSNSVTLNREGCVRESHWEAGLAYGAN